MAINKWNLQAPLFSSFAGMLDALRVFRLTLRFKVLNMEDQELVTTINAMLDTMDTAEQSLKLHLFQLIYSPGKRFSSEEVTASFAAMSQAWEKIPVAASHHLTTAYPIESYEESLKILLADPSAIKSARTDLHLSMAEIMEDELR